MTERMFEVVVPYQGSRCYAIRARSAADAIERCRNGEGHPSEPALGLPDWGRAEAIAEWAVGEKPEGIRADP